MTTIDAEKEKILKPSLPWQQINTVLLDMDGTLLDLHFDNHFWLHYVPQCYARQNCITEEQANQILMSKYSEVQGTLDWYCVDYWTEELSLDIEQLKHEVADKISIRPEVDKFLSWLKRQDKRVVLVTNAHPASLRLKMEVTGLYGHFDKIVHAHELGLAKEHEGFWEKLHTLEPYQPQHTLLIDDNLQVLDSATAYGIKYCLGIHLPDSQGEVMENDRYPALKSFSEIMLPAGS